MSNYYSSRLHSNDLQKCYSLATARIRQFLEAEIEYTLTRIQPHDKVLDLGCGYGRVAERLAGKAGEVTGIDISEDNIALARQLHARKGIAFHVMDAKDLKLDANVFDVTLCLQNGISAFKLDPLVLIRESLRVTRKAGLVIFSTYSEKIWKERLEWFELQAKAGLIGEIDHGLTKNGNIVCRDGFTATTYTREDFTDLASAFGVDCQLTEIDQSVLFCELTKK